jgi:membrane-bound serine protease (ClpP class)
MPVLCYTLSVKEISYEREDSMIQLCIALLILGVIFLLLEMWLPGMEFFAIAGIAALVISAVLAVLYVPNGWLIVAGQGVIVTGFLVHMYRFMKRKQLQGKLILSENLDVPAASDISYLVGREGKAVTVLKPYGEADFNGTHMEVSSYGPMITEGTKVIVTKIEANKIVVRPAEGN